MIWGPENMKIQNNLLGSLQVLHFPFLKIMKKDSEIHGFCPFFTRRIGNQKNFIKNQKFVAFMMFLLLFKFLKFELLGHFRLIFRANFRFMAY